MMSYFCKSPEILGTPMACLICQMLQRAQTRGWAAEVGHREGRVLREHKAGLRETECRRRGIEREQKERLVTNQMLTARNNRL